MGGTLFRSELSIHLSTCLPEFYRFFFHAALKRLGFGNPDLCHRCAIGYAASQAALAVTRSFTRVYFCNALTMPKKFSVFGLPRGASIRCRLLLGLLISAASPSNPMVALFIGYQCKYAAEAQSEWSFRFMKGKIFVMKLAKSNRFLRAPGQAKTALWVSAKTSSAIEGIRHPFGPHAWQPPTAQALIDYWKKHASKSGR